MADKTIWDYPTLATADPNDLILMASDEETYNMKVETLKNAMGEAASKPPIVRNGNWWVWSATQNDYVDSGTAATGPQGSTGDTGPAAGFGTVSATVDNNTGTPSVGITTSGPDTAKNIAFEFHNIKGAKGNTGNTGPAAGFGTVTATVDDNTGTPSVEVTSSGPDTAKNFSFEFHNIKGPTGDVTPAAQQAASDAQAAAQAASGSATAAAVSAREAEDTAAEIKQKLDSASAYGEVGPVPVANIPDALPLDAVKLVVDIEPVQAGSGDPSPTNVRPISGWTGAKVTKCGKNLFDQNDTTYLAKDARSYGKPDDRALAQINTLPAGTYTLSFTEKIVSLNGIEPVETRFGLYLRAINDVQTFNINAQSELITPTVGQIITKSVTFTLTDEYVGKFQYFYVYTGINVSIPGQNIYTANIYDVQLELGSTATDYEPYQGDIYDITFPSTAGTVYGGTLDVVNGVLTVDRGNIASYAGETLPGAWISSMDVYTAGGTPTTGAQVVYELATPQTYQLTPQQVALLRGNNTIFADCGDTTVGYWRDDSLSINKAISERMPDITPLQSGLAALNDSLSATQSGIAIIVSGDRASMAVPVGGYAYIKDNTHGLAEGLYTNTSSAVFPTVGGTADSTVFTAVSGGGLNAIQQSMATLNSKIGYKVIDLVFSNGNSIINNAQVFGASKVVVINASCTANFKTSPLTVGYDDTTFATTNLNTYGVSFTGTLPNVVLTYLVI